MVLDSGHFTPWTALGGGVVLGIAVAMFILLNGRILGISGIVGGLLRVSPKDWRWRLSFLAGLMASPWVWRVCVPHAGWASPRIDATTPTLILAGLLVGFGTRYGAGCTSGHGVCGLARFSPRSMVATLAFMLSGFLTVYVVRHLFGQGV